MVKLAIYTRLSREDETSNSIEHQLNEGNAFAKAKGFKPILYNEGEGISGTLPLEQRPQLANLFLDINSGKIKKVWFRNQNRLERNSSIFFQFMELVIKKDVAVWFGSNKVDFEAPENKLMHSIMAAVNTYKPDLQSLQTKAVLKKRVAAGKVQGRLPYGYTRDENSYMVINESEVETIETIFKLYIEGNGVTKITQYLNEKKVPTRYNGYKGELSVYHWTRNDEGKRIVQKDKDGNKMVNYVLDKSKMKWNAPTITSILNNPIYKGQRMYKGEIYDCPSIIEESVFDKVHKIMKSKSIKRGKKTDYKYLLTGNFKCGVCGSNYYARARNDQGKSYYACIGKRNNNVNCNNKNIRLDIIETFVWEIMFETDTLFEKMQSAIRDGSTDQRRKELTKLMASHQKQLSNLENERKRMVQAVVKGVLKDNEVVGERKRITQAENDYSERLKKNSNEFDRLNNETKVLKDIQNDWGHLRLVDEDMREHLIRTSKKRQKDKAFNPTFNEKQRIIKKYIKSIIIEFDLDAKIYIINVKYNLPIPDESYLIDVNYLAAFNVNLGQFVLWNRELSRSFEPEKFSDAQDQLIKYFPITTKA